MCTAGLHFDILRQAARVPALSSSKARVSEQNQKEASVFVQPTDQPKKKNRFDPVHDSTAFFDSLAHSNYHPSSRPPHRIASRRRCLANNPLGSSSLRLLCSTVAFSLLQPDPTLKMMSSRNVNSLPANGPPSRDNFARLDERQKDQINDVVCMRTRSISTTPHKDLLAG